MNSCAENSFSLYIHVPFCTQKCPYCAFKSAPPKKGDFDAWLLGVKNGAERAKKICGELPKLSTIYIGGGTPTILGPDEWENLAQILRQNFIFLPSLEFTVEANPETLKKFHIDIWKEMGVNRASLGVQSLINEELKFLGRNHDTKTALQALDILQKNFDTSADLIFGLANQNLRGWSFSLRKLLEAGIKHISTYQLTVEEGTEFAKSAPKLSDGYRFYRYAQWLLPKTGLFQYEIASFAAPGHECRHNMSYWKQTDVIALGASAWGYIDGKRYKNSDNFEALPQEIENLRGDEKGIEAAILALRTRDGIDIKDFASRFGDKLLEKIIFELENIPANCVVISGSKIFLTSKGMRVANQIWERILF